MDIQLHLTDADISRLPEGMRHELKEMTVDHGRTLNVECSITMYDEVEIDSVHLGELEIEQGWELLDMLDLYETVSYEAIETAEEDRRASEAEYALERRRDQLDREADRFKGSWF